MSEVVVEEDIIFSQDQSHILIVDAEDILKLSLHQLGMDFSGLGFYMLKESLLDQLHNERYFFDGILKNIRLIGTIRFNQMEFLMYRLCYRSKFIQIKVGLYPNTMQR